MKKKKRRMVPIIIFILIFIIINIILYCVGWYNEMVSGNQIIGSFTTGWNPSDTDGTYNDTEHSQISIGAYFRTFSGVKVKYHIIAEMNAGTAELVVFDVTEKGLACRDREQLEVAYEQVVENSGEFDVDLSGLPENRIYLITVFENEDTDYTMELEGTYEIKRWMYLYDRYFAKFPFVSIKYDPGEVK